MNRVADSNGPCFTKDQLEEAFLARTTQFKSYMRAQVDRLADEIPLEGIHLQREDLEAFYAWQDSWNSHLVLVAVTALIRTVYGEESGLVLVEAE